MWVIRHMGMAHGIAQIHMLTQKLAQSQLLCQGRRQQQPSIGDQVGLAELDSKAVQIVR